MVATHFTALAVLSLIAVSASATYVTPTTKCYASGERAIGAPGKPSVPYYPCCSGEQPRPKKQDYSYNAASDWGEFCGEEGNVVVTASNCHAVGAKAIGAPGYPAVDYKPCCNGRSPRAKTGAEVRTAADRWGMFCMGGTATVTETVAKTSRTRCAGAPGYPYVPYVFCGVNMKCAPSPSDGWGSFCLPKTAMDCVKAGDRNEGASGHPSVPYLPCCSGKRNVAVSGQWGRFCPADGEPKTVTVVTAAPTYYQPTCLKSGLSCDPYGTKCCDGYVCGKSGYGMRCMVEEKVTKAPTTTPPKCLKSGFSCDPYGMKCCDGFICGKSGFGMRCIVDGLVTDAPTTTTETTPMESDEM